MRDYSILLGQITLILNGMALVLPILITMEIIERFPVESFVDYMAGLALINIGLELIRWQLKRGK